MSIRDEDDLERWLEGQPREVAVAIAARAAMRAVPVLEQWLAKNEEKAISSVLLIFRAISVSWFSAVWPSREAKVAAAAADAIYVAADDAADAAFHTFAAAAAAAAFAARAAAAAHAAAFYAAYAAADVARATFYAAQAAADVARAVDTLARAARTANTAARAVAVNASAWKSVEGDANFLTNDMADVASLLQHPLWPDGMPEELRQLWASMKKRLEARMGEHWDVWTNWYDARLDPSREIPCYSPPIPKLERKRVLLPEDVWKAGPEKANAEIKRLIEEYGCAAERDDEAPQPPEELPGVRFRMDEEGRLHAVPSHPDEDEANDPVQQRMFARLKQKMAQLMSHMNAIGNQYPELANVLRDYDEELSVASLAEIDVPVVWMTGLGVVEQAEAFRKLDDTALTPRLEPEVEGLLQEVAGLHGAFISGFRKGRELIARRMQGQFGPDAVERLQEAQQQFLQFATQLSASALTDRVRAVYGKARDVLLLGGMKAEERIAAVLHVSVNSLVAISKGLWPIIMSGMPAATMGPEGVQAWLQFLQTHAGIVAAIAQTSPELRAWLRYLYDKAGMLWPEDDQDT